MLGTEVLAFDVLGSESVKLKCYIYANFVPICPIFHKKSCTPSKLHANPIHTKNNKSHSLWLTLIYTDFVRIQRGEMGVRTTPPP